MASTSHIGEHHAPLLQDLNSFIYNPKPTEQELPQFLHNHLVMKHDF